MRLRTQMNRLVIRGTPLSPRKLPPSLLGVTEFLQKGRTIGGTYVAELDKRFAQVRVRCIGLWQEIWNHSLTPTSRQNSRHHFYFSRTSQAAGRPFDSGPYVCDTTKPLACEV